MPRSSYDVIVVGRELGSLVAATLLSQRGVRVLALSGPHDPIIALPQVGQSLTPLDRYNLGPYVLPTAPMALTGPDAPGLKRIITELNLVQLFRRRIEPNRPGFQLLLPDHRIDVDEDILHAIERESPAALTPFERLDARTSEISLAMESILAEDVMLPPDGFWDRRDGKRVAARLPADDEDIFTPALAGTEDAFAAELVRGLVALPARFATDLVEPGIVASARAAALWRAGSFRIDGGRDGLRAMFLERMRALGGEHRPELRIERFSMKRGRVVGVEVGGSEGEIGAENVLAGISAEALLPLLGDEKPSKRLAELAAPRATLHRYLLHLVVPLDVLPDALGRVAFSVREPRAALVEDNALAIHITDGYGQHAVLSAEALTADPDPKSLASLRKKIRRHLAELLPFLDRHILCVHSPHDGLPAEGVTETAPPPRAMDTLWTPPSPPFLGVCGAPYETGVKGLFLGNRQNLPGLGVEGEIEGGSRLAKIVGGGLKKREPNAALR